MVGSYSWGRKDLSCFIDWRKEATTQSGLRKWDTMGFHGDVRSLREEEERDEGLGEKGGGVVHWQSEWLGKHSPVRAAAPSISPH